MKANWMVGAFLLAASVSYGQTNSLCPSGLYRAPDGSCVGDQTGDQYPAQDGCNVVTCLDERCVNTSVTTNMCSAVGPVNLKRPAVQNTNLSSYFPGVNVFVYPDGNKMMEGFDKDGKVQFTVFRDGRIVMGKIDRQSKVEQK